MFNLSCPYAACSTKTDTSGRYQIKGANLSFKIKREAKDINTYLKPSHTVFHSSSYLQVLEENPLKDTDSFYITVYEDTLPIGVIYAQCIKINLTKGFNWDKDKTSLQKRLQAKGGSYINNRMFIVGNALLAGNYGIRLEGKSTREAFVITQQIVKYALPIIEKENKYKVQLTMYKDFSEAEAAQSECLVDQKFACIHSEPSMVMDIPSHWGDFEGYMDAISSKYKKRARTAFKKSKDLERRFLSVQEIIEHEPKIHELYEMVAHGVDFNLMKLNQQYFLGLKQKFGDDFKLLAYFLEGEMIGYCTTIKDYKETHAHFIGFDKQYNKSHQLYLNMLYDMLKIALENGSTRIDYARTAPEIKSSIGAVPKETYLYIKHNNRLLNRFMPRVVQNLSPDMEGITYRSPFKDEAKASEKKKKKKAKAVTDSEVRSI